jgi:hypothetical protein
LSLLSVRFRPHNSGHACIWARIFFCSNVVAAKCGCRQTWLPPNDSFLQRLDSWFQTFAVLWMLYAFFWVIPRRLNFICRRFGTLCLFHLHRQVGTYPPVKMEQSVPKRRHIKFRRLGITQKKAYHD